MTSLSATMTSLTATMTSLSATMTSQVHTYLLGGAAGVMLCISFVDLLIPRLYDTSLPAICGCFLSGVIFIYALEYIIDRLNLVDTLLPASSMVTSHTPINRLPFTAGDVIVDMSSR